MGDGYRLQEGGAIAGGNQDPCIFGAPVGVLHSYCRIVKRRGIDNDVISLSGPSGQLLRDAVNPGDIVLYGKPVGAEIAVDTVIVVAKVCPFHDVLDEVGDLSDAFAFNLSDHLPLGSHAGEEYQSVIVGSTVPTWNAVQEIMTSFVPLAERDLDGRLRVTRVPMSILPAGSREALSKLFKEDMFGGGGKMQNQGFICEIPAQAGTALVRALIARSGDSTKRPGAVFVPPLRATKSLPRLGADGVVRSNEEHLARLI